MVSGRLPFVIFSLTLTFSCILFRSFTRNPPFTGLFWPILGLVATFDVATELAFVMEGTFRDSIARILILTLETFSLPGTGRNAERMGVRTFDELDVV